MMAFGRSVSSYTVSCAWTMGTPLAFVAGIICVGNPWIECSCALARGSLSGEGV